MKTAHWSELVDRKDRATAKLATIARNNTVFGGATALVLAERMERMGSEIEATAIVADVYSASTGRQHPEHEAWECDECGSVHLGQDAANACCDMDAALNDFS